MVGHNGDEGLLFTDPFLTTNQEVLDYTTTAIPTLKGLPQVVDYINNTLYPGIYDGSQAQNYTNMIERLAAMNSELIFTCNTYYLDKAFKNNTHAYYFVVPPATHGADIGYTFYTGDGQTNMSYSSGSVIAPSIAIAMQEWITHFAEAGTPNAAGLPYFATYTNQTTVETLNTTGITEMMDPAANYRCDWWQKALYA